MKTTSACHAILLGIAAALLAPLAAADHHLFEFEQIYSDAAGKVQFIVMHQTPPTDGEDKWANTRILVTNRDTGAVKGIFINTDLPSSSTADRRVLIGSQSFAALGLIKPDYTMPDGTLPLKNTWLGWADFIFDYSALPTDGKMALEAYSVIRDAMKETDKIALGRVVMHTRERLLAIEPRDRGMVAYSLRSHDEVRDPKDSFDDIPATKADPQMTEIAVKIIEQQEGPFDPSKFVDRYEDALRALIKRKQQGKRPVKAEEPRSAEVIDLMAALRKSLSEKGGGERRKPKAHRQAPKRASHSKARKRA